MAKRKLDNLGYVRCAPGMSNDPERIQRLKNQLGLMQSLAEISKETAATKAANASLETAKLIEAAPAAIAKLMTKGNDLNALNKFELSSISYKHFNGTMLKGNKANHVKQLDALFTDQPGVLQLAAPTAAPTTAAPTLTAPTPAPPTLTAPTLTAPTPAPPTLVAPTPAPPTLAPPPRMPRAAAARANAAVDAINAQR